MSDILISELPIEIREKVFYYQALSGNKISSSVALKTKVHNFTWADTFEGYDFWENINKGKYEEFYNKYPKVDLQKEEEDLYKFLNS